MDLIIKLTASAIISAVLVVLLQKTAPANALVLSIAALVMIALVSVSFLEPILVFFRKLESVCGVSSVYAEPMIKCLLVSVITRIGTSFCKDAGQTGIASVLELSGTLLSVWIAIPLFEALLTMLEELI